MALNVYVRYRIGTDAVIAVENMPSEYDKTLTLKLNGTTYTTQGAEIGRTSLDISLFGLAESYYFVEVSVSYFDGENWQQESGSREIGEEAPYYITSVNGDSVSITVYDIPSTYDYIYYQLYQDRYQSPITVSRVSTQYIFQGLSPGTYYIKVKYSKSGSVIEYAIKDNYGNTGFHQITIDGDAPDFTATVINLNQIQFIVTNRSNYYLRYRVLLASNQSIIYDNDGNLTTNTTLTVSNLAYNTTYLVNVGIADDRYGSNLIWLRLYDLEKTTSSAPVSQDGYAYIYTNQGWKKAIPYIYTNQGWKKAIPYIYTVNGWKKCGE